MTHSDLEYTKRYDQESYDKWTDGIPDSDNTDKLNKKRTSQVPRRIKEKMLIAEILFLAHAFKEEAGRKFTQQTFWSVLPDVTTNTKQSTSETDKGNVSEESILAGVLAPFEGDGNNQTRIITTQNTSDELITLLSDSEDDANDSVVGNDDANDSVVGNDDDNDQNKTEETRVTMGSGVSAREVKIEYKVPINKMGMKDVFKLGNDMIAKEDLVATRLRRNKRICRERIALYDNLYAFLQSKGQDTLFTMNKLNESHDMPEYKQYAHWLRSL